MRLLVFGGWFGSGNLGDEATLIGVREILSKTIPEAQITALSLDPKRTERVCGVNAVQLQSPKTLISDSRDYRRVFSEADACIVTGGTPIYDYGHLSRAIHLGLPGLQRKPVILFGVGVKPLPSLGGREITRLLLMRASLISTRDHPSRRILMQLTRSPIAVTGDSALYLDADEEKVIEFDDPTVLICPRVLSPDYMSHYHEHLTPAKINKVRHMIAKAADRVAETHKVAFIPFHTAVGDDDRQEIKRIMNLMKRKDVNVMTRPESPERALSLLGGADLVLGLRLHSLILASMMRVPVVTVGYDSKIDGFMELAGLGKYLCHPDDGLNVLSSLVDDALNEASDIRRTMNQSIDMMRRRIMGEAVRVNMLLEAQ
ncbi:MAG: polysaccharide pyruvyl transferase family protein [Candidatus Bathyarchaeota archaeon]|nr:polysaccharide pyruvyl transferase family protein [Candidatus Bathyarchaeota archaeon]